MKEKWFSPEAHELTPLCTVMTVARAARLWAWGCGRQLARPLVRASLGARGLAQGQKKSEDGAAEAQATLETLDTTPIERIRNFSIIAHVDHGKSTLSDRLLQMTNTIKAGSRAQYMDKLKVEQERGITVKAQTAMLFYKGHILNLIDTPGHVDFTYEVSRSLAACEGVLLIVDASQGVEAQTLANFLLATKLDLTIVPVVNKIDLPNADIDRVASQVHRLLGCERDELVLVSGKTGVGVSVPIAGEQLSLLDAIIARIPAPTGTLELRNESLQALLFGEPLQALLSCPVSCAWHSLERAWKLECGLVTSASVREQTLGLTISAAW